MAAATQQVERKYKVHAPSWWTPTPEMPLRAPVYYVAQIVDPDALSITEQRVLRVITDVNGGAKQQSDPERGYLCDPGGYTQIAHRAGVCRKTAYNAIKSLKAKGVLREFRVLMNGKQRVKTLYFAPYYGNVLKGWRADPLIFKTSLGRIVVRSRRKYIVTTEEAKAVKMDPDRAPKRGSGRARSDAEQERHAAKVEPSPAPLPSDADLEVIREMFSRVTNHSNLKDAIDLLREARAEADRLGYASIEAAVVAALMLEIARLYKTNPKYPSPTPKWFINKISGAVSDWVRAHPPTARAPDARAG
jgi:hypothetical protein